MAIALDAVSSRQIVNPGTSLTYAFTVGSGANRLLFVGGVSGSASDVITGITYAGVAMTRIAISADASTQRAFLYYLVAPTSGANNVVISASGSVRIDSRAVAYSGASQTGIPEASTTAASTSVTSIAPSLTPVKQGCWVVGFFRNNVDNSATASGGTLRDNGDGLKSDAIIDSNGVVAAGSATTFTYSFSAADACAVMASFPGVAAGQMFEVF